MNPSWPATQWTLICRAGSLPPAERQDALARLVEMYRGPIESTLARLLAARGVPPARSRQWAEDLASGFVADKWLQGDMLSRLDRSGPARFKTFLYKCLSDHVVDALRRSTREAAAKRSAAAAARESAEARGAHDPFGDAVRRFERNLALTDLREAFLETRRWCEDRGWQDTFRRFCGSWLGSGEPSSAPPALPERTWRDRSLKIRTRLNEAYRRRVAASCLTEEEVDREIAYLDGLLLELEGSKWATLAGEADLQIHDD